VRSVYLLVACCAQQASGRFFNDNRGPLTHEHKFLWFCGDDGDDGGICTGECTYPKADLKWPLRADGLTYMTHAVCTAVHKTCTGAMANRCGFSGLEPGASPPSTPVSWSAGSIVVVDNTRDPLFYPFGGATPLQQPVAGSSTLGANVMQPVVTPHGKRESNPHHLRWPVSRDPHDIGIIANSVGAKVAKLRTNAFALGVSGGEANEKSELAKLVQHPWDPHLLNVWDRIHMKDGQMLATTFDRKYTPTECARICNKMARFRANHCIAFTRKWFTSEINEHYDSAGRDNYGHTSGKEGQVGHEVGGKAYKWPGQCVFFGKMMDNAGHLTITNLCTTVQDWLLDAWGVPWNIGNAAAAGDGKSGIKTIAQINAEPTSCQYRHGVAKTNYQDKARSWRIVTEGHLGERGSGAGFMPAKNTEWPKVTPSHPPMVGRRLDGQVGLLDVNATDVHEFILPDGTTFWAQG